MSGVSICFKARAPVQLSLPLSNQRAVSRALLKFEWGQSSPNRNDRVGVRGGSRIGRSKGQGQTRQRQQYLPLREFAREALWDTVVLSGLAFVEEELEAERALLCGPRYTHVAGREAIRAGHVASSLTLGGRRAEVKRPRARSINGHELALPSWQTWSSRDPLHERAAEQLVLAPNARRNIRLVQRGLRHR
jgi:hypothetical protein